MTAVPPGAGLGQALDPAVASELYRREVLQRREARHRPTTSPVELAFQQFKKAAGRRAALATQYLVPEHDFMMLIDTLTEHLEHSCALPDGLDQDNKRELTRACMTYARAHAGGDPRRADGVFAAELAAVQDAVQARHSEATGR